MVSIMLMKALVVAFLAIFTAHGLELTSPFSSNAVLPMDTQVTLRGRKTTSDTIAVTFNGSTIEGKISSLSSKPQAQAQLKPGKPPPPNILPASQPSPGGPLKVPIGIIANAVGGTGTEAWLPALTLRTKPSYLIQLPNIGGNDAMRLFWPPFSVRLPALDQ